jgi:hypothetical protein
VAAVNATAGIKPEAFAPTTNFAINYTAEPTADLIDLLKTVRGYTSGGQGLGLVAVPWRAAGYQSGQQADCSSRVQSVTLLLCMTSETQAAAEANAVHFPSPAPPWVDLNPCEVGQSLQLLHAM